MNPQLKAQLDGSLMPTYGRFPVALVSGQGAVATDDTGKTYIDFGSGIGVNALGYCDNGWLQAVMAQAATLQHISNLYYSPVQAELAAALCRATGMDKAFLCNSGAEANECAIKLARKYSFDTYGAGRSTIVGMKNSFHGRTITTLAATGQDSFHQNFFPFTEGFVFAEAGRLDDLLTLLDDSVCAVLLECIQGEGGVIPLPADYLQAVRRLCTERDILLLVDEVQTGAGRTGKFLACEHAGILPDVVTMAKGIGGGLPIGACLSAPAFANVLSAGTHGSTFGGNPVCCAGALSVLSRIDEAFLADVRKKSDYITSQLEGASGVISVSGRGLMLGIECERPAKDVISDCLANGVLVLSAKTKVRLLPPLCIGFDELAEGIAILKEALAK